MFLSMKKSILCSKIMLSRKIYWFRVYRDYVVMKKGFDFNNGGLVTLRSIRWRIILFVVFFRRKQRWVSYLQWDRWPRQRSSTFRDQTIPVWVSKTIWNEQRVWRRSRTWNCLWWMIRAIFSLKVLITCENKLFFVKGYFKKHLNFNYLYLELHLVWYLFVLTGIFVSTP